ncbi:MAG TPA: PPOX class F420-dependent oxidoreductase [Terriglobales bacterium]|nr:PPOX class F420-dependent oxidoreductase [Terriglobales bacterium]
MSATDRLAQFHGRRYLNLESYRKDGRAVRTPLWFAEADGLLYIYTLAESGKVKRIRRNPRVRIVPSDIRGTPRGEWIEAEAQLLEGERAASGDRLLSQKYVGKRIGDLFRKLRPKPRAVLAIRPLP